MTALNIPAIPNLLRVADLDAERFATLLDLAAAFKREPPACRQALAGRSVACYFVPDTARVLSGYCDAIGELAEHATVPVINALTDEHHPCQALADCLTLREVFGSLDGLPVAYVGDANNVAASVAEAAVAGAAAVYTDVWVSMGQEAWAKQRRAMLAGYRVTPELMALARPDAVFMHCLPAHRGEEVDSAVIDGPASQVWRQAANRLPAEQALLYALVTGNWEV
jgi:ornithine carbamoyltransferase